MRLWSDVDVGLPRGKSLPLLFNFVEGDLGGDGVRCLSCTFLVLPRLYNIIFKFVFIYVGVG